jgi:hypothetical protein
MPRNFGSLARVRHLDLNDLRVIVRVVDRGGFAVAARELGVPTSTVSRTIARLEASTAQVQDGEVFVVEAIRAYGFDAQDHVLASCADPDTDSRADVANATPRMSDVVRHSFGDALLAPGLTPGRKMIVVCRLGGADEVRESGKNPSVHVTSRVAPCNAGYGLVLQKVNARMRAFHLGSQPTIEARSQTEFHAGLLGPEDDGSVRSEVGRAVDALRAGE